MKGVAFVVDGQGNKSASSLTSRSGKSCREICTTWMNQEPCWTDSTFVLGSCYG